jgi:gamma-glutamylcysteine synthetase
MNKRKVGVEFEYPVVFSADGKGINRETIQAFWAAFAKQNPEWKLTREKIRKTLYGVSRTHGGYTEVINTDAGVCTIELSMRPFDNVADLQKHFVSVFQPLDAVAEQMGLKILAMGCQPLTGYDWLRETQADSYLIWDKKVTYHNLMVPIAAHQAAVDISIDEWIPVTNMLAALSGPMIALAASSPIFQGKVLEVKEHRAQVWDLVWERQKDPRMAEFLTNDIPHVPFADLNEYFQTMWQTRLFFPRTANGEYHYLLRSPRFIDFISNRKPQAARNSTNELKFIRPEDSILTDIANYAWFTNRVHYFFDEKATIDKALEAYYNSTMEDFCRKYVKRLYIENRPCGVAAKGEEMAMPSMVLGLVENWQAAEALTRKFTWNEWKHFRADAIKYSLQFPKSKESHLNIIKEMLNIARTGLRNRGLGEEQFLQPYFKRLQDRRSNADDILATFTYGGIPALLREHSY